MEVLITDKYILGKKLGKGAFGEIFQGILRFVNVAKVGVRTARKWWP